jgi:tRNA-specific 2-thiouridylase
VADKPDSQDICFVPKGHYTTVVDTLRPAAARPGEIVHQDGRVLGRHDGITRFTVGQRKGLGLPVAGAASEPLFVLALDAPRARVIVGPREALARHRVQLRDVNWLGDGALTELSPEGLDIAARIRSSGPPQPARLVWTGGGPAVEFPSAVYGVSPGQACVFYADASGGARVLGGGWIVAAAQRKEAGHADDLDILRHHRSDALA